MYIVVFIALFLYGQRIQLSIMRRGVRGQIAKLDKMQSVARARLIDSLKKFVGNPNPSSPGGLLTVASASSTLDSSVDRLLGSFVIPPVNVDPSGIVPKMEHILNTADENLRKQVGRMAPAASESDVQTLSNVAEIAIGLNNMYKIARHYYILGTKGGGTYSLVQLQMLMPQMMEIAEAYNSAMEAFVGGKTVGDGFGPLVAAELVNQSFGNTENVWSEMVKDTEVAKISLHNHTAYVVKAKGPGGNVGKPGEAIREIIAKDQSVKCVLTVDASLKLEGEETGSMAEGIGAAIGGPGVDRFRIEEAASARNIEMLAIVAKMSEKEAISEIPKGVRDKVQSTVERIRSMVRNFPEGTSIIIAGIGNTLGVA